MTDESEELYQCIGICMADPETGACMGCGRPPLGSPEVFIELAPPAPANLLPGKDPDTPQ